MDAVCQNRRHRDVAPFTGAWIEIFDEPDHTAAIDEKSHPSRVRGLKYKIRRR